MGSRRVFSDEQEKFIFDNYKGKANQEICDLLYANFKQVFTTRQIIWFKNRHGLHSFDPLFPAEIVAYIQDNRLEKFHQDLTDEINNQFGTSYTKNRLQIICEIIRCQQAQEGFVQKYIKRAILL